MRLFISVVFISLFVIIGCKREEDIIGSNLGNGLAFEIDTNYLHITSDDEYILHFDTVFAQVGSATRYLKLYNRSANDINLNSVYLEDKSSSNFRINVDGESTNEKNQFSVNDVLIRSNDSIYIFADVTIDPFSKNNPLVKDKIIIEHDNSITNIELSAYGIDAHFHSGIPDLFNNSNIEFFDLTLNEETINLPFYVIDQDTDWVNDKAHVIYGNVIVTNGATLNITQGTNIFLHNNSNIIIDNQSSLKMKGECYEKASSNNYWDGDKLCEGNITLEGDRLEDWYQGVPGQWGRIWFWPGSINNEIEYTIIKNGTIGIQVDGENNIDKLTENPILNIKNSVIHNMSGLGILAQGASVNGENLLISNCGQYGLALNIGGKYNFNHCTFANYYVTQSRQTPNIFINNNYEDIDGNMQYRPIKQAYFRNCIIYGNNDDELIFDNNPKTEFNYYFDHCLIKTTNNEFLDKNPNFNQCLFNENPGFMDENNGNFFLDLSSPAVNIGAESKFNLDFFNINRSNLPDLGPFETDPNL